MKALSVTFTIISIVVSNIPLTHTAGSSEEALNYGNTYTDALVATMELLHSINGTLRSISLEFDRIQEKLGTNISQIIELCSKYEKSLERSFGEIEYKFQSNLLSIDVAANPLQSSFFETMTENLETLKKKADEMENEHIQTMVETIKDEADEGLSDLIKFQDNIDETMRRVSRVAATAKTSTRKMGKLYRSTPRRSFFLYPSVI